MDIWDDPDWSRISISLTIGSRDMTVEQIADIIGLQASVGSVADSVAENDEEDPDEYSEWKFQSDSVVDSQIVARHFEWFVFQLQGKTESIKFLKERGCRFLLNVHLDCGHGGPLPSSAEISASQLKLLSDLDLDINFWFWPPN